MGQSAAQSLGLIIFLAVYVIFALPLYSMGKKTGSDYAWMAFVPILNIVLMCDIAGKDLWWVILFFVPCVNIVIAIIVWMGIAEAMDKPNWLGILMLVPGLNVLIPFYLAYG